MSRAADKLYRLLIEEEKRFAKRVVYIMRAETPPPWWHLLIPFRFVMEYFAFRKNFRQFTEKYLLFKHMALTAAFNAVQGGDRDRSKQEMHSELRDFWMHRQKIQSRELYEHLGELADLSMEHYIRLLETGERDYTSMIRSAYRKPSEYRDHLERIGEVEAKIDRAAHDAFGLDAPDPHTVSRRKAMQEARMQHLREVF